MTRRSLFREKSLEHISSPEQLDQYLQVSTPRSRTVLVVLALLIVAAVAALALASVPVTEAVTITVEDGRATGLTSLPDGTYRAEVTTGDRRLVDLALGL